MRLDVRNYLKPGEQPLWNEAGKWPMAKERVTKPTKPDPPRGSTVKKHVRPAASRSGMGSCRTVLANSIPSVTWRTAAGLRSRVPHRYYLRPSQRHSLADAPARTRVRVEMTCWRRLRDWQLAGVWDLIHFAALDWLARLAVRILERQARGTARLIRRAEQS